VEKAFEKSSSFFSLLVSAANAENRTKEEEEAEHYAQHLSPLCVPLRCVVLFNQTSFLVVVVYRACLSVALLLLYTTVLALSTRTLLNSLVRVGSFFFYYFFRFLICASIQIR
jgi:hypothetical protein